jgi:hypothetical protein
MPNIFTPLLYWGVLASNILELFEMNRVNRDLTNGPKVIY